MTSFFLSRYNWYQNNLITLCGVEVLHIVALMSGIQEWRIVTSQFHIEKMSSLHKVSGL
jgi:hypothetical protein